MYGYQGLIGKNILRQILLDYMSINQIKDAIDLLKESPDSRKNGVSQQGIHWMKLQFLVKSCILF